MSPQPTNREPNAALIDRRIGLGLRELDHLETPPDVAAAVAERLAIGEGPRQRASNMPVLLVAMLAIAATVAVFVFHEGDLPTSEAPYGTNPQDTVVETVTSAEEIAQLPATTKHVLGKGLSGAAITALRKLRQLERLDLDASPTIDSDYLKALGELNGLKALHVHGYFAAPPAAFEPLGLLPRLAELTLLEPTPGPMASDQAQPGLGDEHLSAARWTKLARLRTSGPRLQGAFLPALAKTRLRALSLAGCRNLDPQHLARLRKLEELDLTDTNIRDAATRPRSLPGCLVTCSNGLRLRMPTDPKQEPERLAWTVELGMRDGSDYGVSAFSFCRRTTDPAVHANYVDLVWSTCKNVHFNNYGGQNNRIRDLGQVPLAQARTTPGAWDEVTNSFVPQPGHTYAFEVREGSSFHPFVVVFHVVSISDTTLTLAWHHLDETQDPGELPNRGAAGASGACSGPHEPR